MRVGGLVLAWAMAWPIAAVADPTVVVATSDRAVTAALEDALAPAGMRVTAVGDAPPAAIGTLASASRELATRAGADAVVWLITDAGGTTLAAYDRGVDRVLVRTLPYASPLTATQAAETARMARTMLRALQIDESATAPREVPRSPVAVTEGPAPVPARPVAIAALAGAGMRLGTVSDDPGLEVHVGAVWRPDGFGLAAIASASPATSIMNEAFTGSIADRSFAVAGRLGIAVTDRVRVSAIAGLALHVVGVDGRLADGDPVSSLRLDPAARVGGGAGYAVTGWLEVGLVLSTDALLRRQRYESAAGGAEIAVIPRVQLSAGLIASLRVL